MANEAEPLKTTFVLYRTYKSIDDEVLVSDVFGFLVSVVVCYLAFVLKIGPAIMKGRKPFQLKKPLLCYNAFQVVLSVFIASLAFRALLAAGVMPRKVPQTDPEILRLFTSAGKYFYLGKFTELLDTIFFVFRKKYNQITFLHVYHHSSVIIGSWMMLKFGMSLTGVWGVLMNALVHVAMYLYYFLAALGPQYQKYLTWKKYMTSFQMIQFVTVFTHQTVSILYSKGEHSLFGIFYEYFTSIVFFTLFYQFYQANYKKNTTSNGISNGHVKNDSKVN